VNLKHVRLTKGTLLRRYNTNKTWVQPYKTLVLFSTQNLRWVNGSLSLYNTLPF